MELERLHVIMQYNSYSLVKSNTPIIKVYYKLVNNETYLVNIINQEDYPITKEQYLYLRKQIIELFSNKGYNNISLLNIICTNDTQHAKEIMDEEDYHWIIDTKTNRVIIYENQPTTYLNMEDIISNFLNDKIYSPRATNSYKKESLSKVTVSLVVINTLIWLIMEIIGSSESSDLLIRFGASYAPLISQKGQYYRLFSAMFLHIGFSHLINNMLVLFIIGNRLEKIVGSIKFTIIYILTGILASLISYINLLYTSPNTIAAGASGAIFGLVGAMFYIILRNKGKVGDIGIRQISLMIISAIYNGFTNAGIDNVAHIAGLLTGIIFALILYRKPKAI